MENKKIYIDTQSVKLPDHPDNEIADLLSMFTYEFQHAYPENFRGIFGYRLSNELKNAFHIGYLWNEYSKHPEFEEPECSGLHGEVTGDQLDLHIALQKNKRQHLENKIGTFLHIMMCDDKDWSEKMLGTFDEPYVIKMLTPKRVRLFTRQNCDPRTIDWHKIMAISDSDSDSFDYQWNFKLNEFKRQAALFFLSEKFDGFDIKPENVFYFDINYRDFLTISQSQDEEYWLSAIKEAGKKSDEWMSKINGSDIASRLFQYQKVIEISENIIPEKFKSYLPQIEPIVTLEDNFR